MEWITDPQALIALLTLTVLEIVLGIDNIIFISITASRLPEKDQKRATQLGLMAAMVLRVLLLFGLSFLTAMQKSIITIENKFFHVGFSIQSLILILGGFFLMYKSVTEIHHKLCLLYTSPSPRDRTRSRMPSSA